MVLMDGTGHGFHETDAHWPFGDGDVYWLYRCDLERRLKTFKKKKIC